MSNNDGTSKTRGKLPPTTARAAEPEALQFGASAQASAQPSGSDRLVGMVREQVEQFRRRNAERERVPTSASEPAAFAAVAGLLGDDRLVDSPGDDPVAAHDRLVAGLPGEALEHLSRRITILSKQELLEQGLGISLRTYQRRREAGDKPLSAEQSGRLWKFAEILVQAAELFGSREEAEIWLARPAVGLDQRRPIDLLASPVGVALVEEHLGRLRHGVYT